MQQYNILSAPARQALEAFAAKYATVEGGWKEHLCQLWATGGDTQEEAGSLLRLIRNRYGPSWLLDTYAALWTPELPAYEVARWSEDGTQLLPTEAEGVARWSGRRLPGDQTPAAYVQAPAIGATVVATVNKIGEVVVTGYFVEEGWLGFIGRAPDGALYHLFGIDLKVPEIKPADETAEARAALATWGLMLAPRAEIMDTAFPVQAYEGTPNATPEEIEAKHEQIRVEWRERVSRYPGAWVVYDPAGDAEDWMLVGDDFAALAKESVEHHEEIADN